MYSIRLDLYTSSFWEYRDDEKLHLRVGYQHVLLTAVLNTSWHIGGTALLTLQDEGSSTAPLGSPWVGTLPALRCVSETTLHTNCCPYVSLSIPRPRPFNPEDGGRRFLSDIGNRLQGCRCRNTEHHNLVVGVFVTAL